MTEKNRLSSINVFSVNVHDLTDHNISL